MRKLLFVILSIGLIFCLDYSLEDVNPNSDTFELNVGPSYFQAQGKLISISTFNHENWGGWRALFAQLCDMSNNNEWDTDNASFIGVGAAEGGDGALDGMLNPNGVDVTVPWVQDPEKEIWDEFLGPNAPRRQIILLDQNLEKQFQQQYGGAMNNQEKAELLAAIQDLINEIIVLGDMNEDMVLNVLDVIIVVNMALGNVDIDLNGDMNNDGGINILDVVILANIILTDE